MPSLSKFVSEGGTLELAEVTIDKTKFLFSF